MSLKIFTIITITLGLSLTVVKGWEPTGNSLFDFRNFKSSFNRKYESLNEEIEKYGTLNSNINFVNGFNRREASQSVNSLFNRTTFVLGVNEYSDMKHEEFVLRLLGYKRELREQLSPSNQFRLNPSLQIPESVGESQAFLFSIYIRPFF